MAASSQMQIWQADFYHYSQPRSDSKRIWTLLVCDRDGNVLHQESCSSSQATADWLREQLCRVQGGSLPEVIQSFRPQTLNLLTVATQSLGVRVEGNRRTAGLKQQLRQQFQSSSFDPLKLEQPPPQPLPEQLWGEQWCFASIPAGDLVEAFSDRPIPILEMSPSLFPVNLGLASTVSIPGVVIYGGRQSMYLARWLDEKQPFGLNYIPKEVGQSGGLVLETGLVDRWILATFEDAEMAQRGTIYQQRQQESLGLHFLLVQPDDSGMTYSGFWLLGE